MSPRKTILRELSRAYDEKGAPAFQHPGRIDGFDREPDKFQKAVNQLLQDRPIEGHKDDDGRMAIGLNGQKLADVRRELRPVWARPAVWAAAALVAVVILGAAGLMG